MKKWIGILLVAGALLAIACTQPKVTLCHATHSSGNPFNLITVDADAVFKQGHDQHQDGEDIIPAFTYYVNEVVGREHKDVYHSNKYEPGSCHLGWSCKSERDVMGDVAHQYAGKNLTTLYGWGATGAAVLANGCEIPEKPYVACDEEVDQGWAYYN